MGLLGLEAACPKRSTSRPAPGHKIYPYLLRRLQIVRPNHVWASDITYIPMQHGFLYLTAVMDLFSRNVLSWKLSNTLTGDFCIEALDEALSRSRPEIFNTDQGAQFTATAYTSRLESHGVAISMDGRGRALDNVFVERLWRSVKYEEVCLRDYADGWEPEKSLRRCFDDSRNERIHQTLGYRTPAAVYAGGGRVRAQFSVETNSERSDVKRHPVRELIRGRVRPLEWISRATIPTPPSPRRKSFQRMRSTSVAHLRFVISVHSHAVLSGAVAGGCHRPIHKRNPP